MEKEPDHVFIDPEVIEVHLRGHSPIPQGTLKLLLAFKLLDGPEAPEVTDGKG